MKNKVKKFTGTILQLAVLYFHSIWAVVPATNRTKNDDGEPAAGNNIRGSSGPQDNRKLCLVCGVPKPDPERTNPPSNYGPEFELNTYKEQNFSPGPASELLKEAEKVVKDLTIVAVGEIPIAGGLVQYIIGVLWSNDSTNGIWDAVTEYVEEVVGAALFDFEFDILLDNHMVDLKSYLDNYNDAIETNADASQDKWMSDALAKAVEIDNFLHLDQDKFHLESGVEAEQLEKNIRTVELALPFAVTHMGILKEVRDYGGLFWDGYDTNEQTSFQNRMETAAATYTSYFNWISPRWKAWRTAKITNKCETISTTSGLVGHSTTRKCTVSDHLGAYPSTVFSAKTTYHISGAKWVEGNATKLLNEWVADIEQDMDTFLDPVKKFIPSAAEIPAGLKQIPPVHCPREHIYNEFIEACDAGVPGGMLGGCTNNDHCSSGDKWSVCSGGQCRSQQYSGCGTNEHCVSGLCVSNRCISKTDKRLGESCLITPECDGSLKCKGGSCKLSNGSRCRRNSDCAGGLCQFLIKRCAGGFW